MRPVHKTALFKFIQRTRYKVEDFIYTDNVTILGTISTQLNFRNSPLSFFIAANPNDFNYYRWAGNQYSPTNAIYPFQSQYVNFETILSAFFIWLDSNIKSYLEDQGEPDHWENYLRASQRLDIYNIGFDQKDDVFAPEEKKLLRTVLAEYRTALVLEFHPSADQIGSINERIDYLIGAIDRLNKFDWKGTLINTLITVCVALSLDAQRGKDLLELFMSLFHRILLN